MGLHSTTGDVFAAERVRIGLWLDIGKNALSIYFYIALLSWRGLPNTFWRECVLVSFCRCLGEPHLGLLLLSQQLPTSRSSPLTLVTTRMDRAMGTPCYTCRSRRIQCDQSGIPCGKCTKAGLECFDKRPFRWVKGVAIRGKMQGRSYENAATSRAADTLPSVSGSANAERALIRSSHAHPGPQSGGIQLNGMPFAIYPPCSSV